MSKLVQKIPKIIEATSSWSLDLLDLSCVYRTTILRRYYQQSTITCCYFAVWDDESETIPWKINMVFPSELFFLCYPSSKRAGHCSLSKFVNSCYQMLRVPVSSHWWYWLKRVQVKLVAFNHRNFDWKFVCCLLLYWSHLSSFQR